MAAIQLFCRAAYPPPSTSTLSPSSSFQFNRSAVTFEPILVLGLTRATSGYAAQTSILKIASLVPITSKATKKMGISILRVMSVWGSSALAVIWG